MMIEIQLPTYVSENAQAIDAWNTQVNILPSGKQQRAALQSKVLGRWIVAFETVDETKHKALRNFKLAVKGAFHAFRFQDPADFKSDGQQNCSPAVGTGALTTFQLQKTYTVDAPGTSYVRTVTKPVNGTVEIYVNSVLQAETTHYTINYATGVVTFTGAPTNGHTVKAKFQFDKPAHFVNDDMPVTVEQALSDTTTGAQDVYHHESMEIEEVDEI
jgi:uncharacterized protein (TIGR02217 family)